jgi:hypothetical protein
MQQDQETSVKISTVNPEFESFASHLSPQTLAVIESEKAEDDKTTSTLPDETARFCLIECTDGETPLMRAYASPEAMGERIRVLDGTDTHVFMVFGVPCRITKAPNRMLLLPQDTAIQLTPAIVMIDVMEESVEIEANGFLGLPELMIVTNPEAREARRRSVQPAKPKDDDNPTGVVAD